MATNRKMSTKTMVLGAVMTAIVIVLQLMGSFIRFGMFSISLVLVPIVIGAALGGKTLSTWLGFAFGLSVLLSGDAASFLAISVHGTVITVLAKGMLCGLAAGIVYELFEKMNITVAVFVSAIICPIVNTAVFAAGCYIFFYEGLKGWLASPDLAQYDNVTALVFLFLIGGNFFVELAANIILNPVIVRIINIRK